MRGGRGTEAPLPWAVELVGGECRGNECLSRSLIRTGWREPEGCGLKIPGRFVLFCLKMGEILEYLNADVKEPKEMKRLRSGSERRF